MVDLLNNNKKDGNDFLSARKINSKEIETTILGKKKQLKNIKSENRYNDLDGLSLFRINFGLWYVANRKHFIFMLCFILGVIGFVTWTLYFYTFGHYIFIGMKEDKKMASNMIKINIPDHNFFIKKAPNNLIIENFQNFKNDNNSYTFLVKIKNPNKNYYSTLKYSLFNGKNEIKTGSTFIFPNKSKNLLISVDDLKYSPTSVKFQIINDNWHRIDKHIYPDWDDFYKKHYEINFSDIKFTKAENNIISEKIKLNNLEFIVKNNSAFNYVKIDLIILLQNNTKIIEVNKYSLENFMSGDVRKIDLILPGTINNVNKVNIFPEIDITKNDIYIEFDGDNFYK